MSEADLDLLADYVGGALDGTPDAATVASLVADDPEWAAAHAALTGALDAVQADLRTLSAQAEPMPDDVAERIGAALAAAAADAGAVAPDEPGRSRGGLTVVPVDPPARAARRRRRWPTWATPVGVAAGLLVCGGLSLTWVNQQGVQSDSSAGSTAQEDSAAAPPAAGGADATRQTTATARSGTDYTRQSLGALVAKGGAASVFEGGEARTADSPGTLLESPAPVTAGSQAAIAPLARLEDPAGLQACLDAIGLAHGNVPVTVTGVDYARFEGRPALVVVFTDQAGERWAWASGPECGVAGTDELYSTRVG